ncbi:MAG: signal peptidase II [Bacteroidia bacterium]
MRQEAWGTSSTGFLLVLVVDFMHMYFGMDWTSTGIFNVADLYITFGVAIYLIALVNLIKNKGKGRGSCGKLSSFSQADCLGVASYHESVPLRWPTEPMEYNHVSPYQLLPSR